MRKTFRKFIAGLLITSLFMVVSIPVVTGGTVTDTNQITLTPLTTPSTPVITPVGATGSTTWSYKIVAKLSDGSHTAASTAGSTTTGKATINDVQYNHIRWSKVTNADSYDVYRTTAGTSPSTTGLIANTTDNKYDDIGGAGDSSTPPTTNTTGISSATTLIASSSIGILEGGTSPTKYTYLTGGDQTVDVTYTLPTGYAAANGNLLASTTAGVQSWSTGLVWNSSQLGITGTVAGTKAANSASADGTRNYSYVVTDTVDPASSAEVNGGYFAYNKSAGSNGTFTVNALEGVARAQWADESATMRGVYGRFYIDAATNPLATLRTGVGVEASARASYSGGPEVAAEAGTAFVGERIWMAPYFSAATVNNVNNFWGLWIYGENASQRNGDAAIKIGDAGGGFTADLNLQHGTKITNSIAGNLILQGDGATNDENIIYDFETTANKIGISSTTGVATLDHTNIGIHSTIAEGAAVADGSYYNNFIVNATSDPSSSAEVGSLIGQYNWSAGTNGTFTAEGVQGVVRSKANDESGTYRGGYFRTYIDTDTAPTASMRTAVGLEASARASYSGGVEATAESGTAFIGERIWMAPYFSAASVGNINNFWGLWIYGEHASQKNGDAAIKISDAGGGFTDDIILQSGAKLTNETTGATTLDSSLQITSSNGVIIGSDVAGGSPNVAGSIKLISAGDNAFYTTITSGTNNPGNIAYTLPVDDGGVGTYLKSDGSGVLSWDTPAGFAWGASITGTTTGGTTITLANTSDSGAIGLGLVVGNTQSDAVVAQKIDLGTSTANHTALQIETGLGLGSAIDINVPASVSNAHTNGYIDIAFNDTQDYALTAIKIDLGSADNRAHKGIDFPTIQEAATATSKYGIYQGSIVTTGATGIGEGIHQDIIATDAGTGYGIYQRRITSATGATGYGIYQDRLQDNGGNAYGLYQNYIAVANSDTAIGWYVGNLQYSANNGENVGKYFSLNNATSGAITTNRTLDTAEILYSRTNTATTGTLADNFNILNIKRTNVQNGAGGTLTTTGTVLKLENVATQTAGTLTDSVDVLSLVQDTDSTGSAISVTTGDGTNAHNVIKTNNFAVRTYHQTVTLATDADHTHTGITPNGVILGAAIRVGTQVADIDSADHHIKLGITGTTAKYCDASQGSAATTIDVNKKAKYNTDFSNAVESSELILTIDGGTDNTPSAGAVEVEVTYLYQDDIPNP